MKNQLRRLLLNVEPKALDNKSLCNYNSYFFKYLISRHNYDDFQAFTISIHFLENQNYEYYWKQIQFIINRLNTYFNYNYNSIFFAYGIEMHRPSYINEKKKLKLNDDFVNFLNGIFNEQDIIKFNNKYLN